MAIHTSLRQFLIANEVIPNASNKGKIQYSKVDKGVPLPVIWFERSGGSTGYFANGTPEFTTDNFDMEIVCETDGKVFGGPEGCQTLTNTIRTLLHLYPQNGHGGAFGDDGDVIQWIKVNDQSDSYVPKLVDQDNGWYPLTLSIEICSRPA